jgi:hypothetical protein
LRVSDHPRTGWLGFFRHWITIEMGYRSYKTGQDMKQIPALAHFLLGLIFLCATHAVASDQKLPIIAGKKIVATVAEEPITLEELNQAIAATHAERSRETTAGRVDFSNIMNRLITTRLIVLEARNMGLDELPEIKSEINAYARQLQMEILFERHVRDIRVDEDEIDKAYEAMVREWKIKSLKLKKQADALKIESRLKAGQDFDKVLQKAIEWGVGEADPQGEYLQEKDLARPVAQLVSKMSIGSISPMLSIGDKGFIVFKLEDIRIPEVEDPRARETARRQALNNKRVQAAKAYYRNLKKRHIKFLDQELLDSLNYETQAPGFEKLLKDRRILVKIKGEKSITVGEFTQALKQKFYHGVQRAIESKRIHPKKQSVLEDMLQKRILLKEARAQGIDRTDEFNAKVKAHEIASLFGIFIDKVVAPNIKLDIEALQTYYQNNSEAFASPQMIRIKSLVFWNRDDAVAAIKKLKAGTDFNWLGSNADGQVDKNEKGRLNFEGKLLTQKGLPQDVQKAISNSKPGDFKLYESPPGHFYVLFINQVISPKPQPFESVRKEIAKKVFKEKVKATIEQWAEQLKEYYPVKIYKTDLR